MSLPVSDTAAGRGAEKKRESKPKPNDNVMDWLCGPSRQLCEPCCNAVAPAVLFAAPCLLPIKAGAALKSATRGSLKTHSDKGTTRCERNVMHAWNQRD